MANGEFHLKPAQILMLGFAAVIAAGAILLTLPAATINGRGLSFVDALFTATSATCVTGLVVVDTQTTFSIFGKVVILSLIQVGGLGIMTMSTMIALILGKRIGLRERMVMQEALNVFSTAGVVRLTKMVLVVTLLIEGTGALLLWWRWWPDLGGAQALWYGVFHAVSSFNNAGFDLFGDFRSLTPFISDVAVNLIISSLIILGGIGFAVIADLHRKREFGKLTIHSKLALITTGWLILIGTILILFFELNNPLTLQPLSWKGKLLAAYFQSVSPRTAGFNTLDLVSLHSVTQFLIVILMFIGASPGSTGGGIKTTTFGAILLTVWGTITGKSEVIIYERRLPRETIRKALVIVTTSMALVIAVTMALLITQKADFLALMFEATSAFGTVGLSMGVTPDLTPIGRLIIAFTMYAGRVGPLTVAFALTQQLGKANVKYLEEKIMIG